MHYDALIVGAGHAGAQAAIQLRQLKFAGTVGLLTDEPDLPYERPPLSKEYLAGDKPFERMLFRPASFWSERQIALHRNCQVSSVEAAAHKVHTSDGRTFGYGSLVWATGGVPRALPCPGADLPGVYALRTRKDADLLRAAIPRANRVVIVGGGYIGLEVAAVLTRLGKPVTIVEVQDRLLARITAAPLSTFLAREHEANGVALRMNVAVAEIIAAEGHVSGVRLQDGTRLPADLVLVGIGIIPSIAPMLAAGASGGDGVDVDAQCRTSLPDVFAIGDCARHANRYAEGAMLRLESVQNAHDQAQTVARLLTGTPAEYDSIPWFWSHQYDLKLQTVGLVPNYDAFVVRGDPASRSFSVVYGRGGRVCALTSINMPRDYVQGRALIGLPFAPDRLADTSTALKDLV